MQLAVDHHGVDARSAVIHRDIAKDCRSAGLRIDFHDADVRSERPDEVAGIEEGRRLKAALHALRQTVGLECRHGDLLDGDRFRRRAFHEGLAVLVNDVAFGRLQQVGGDLAGLLLHLHGTDMDRVAVQRRAPAAVGVHPHGSDRRVAVLHVDVLDRDAQHVGGHLRVGRLVALAVRRAADDHGGLTGEMDVHHRHAPERDAGRGLGGRRRPQSANLDIGGEANADVLALFALLRLLTPKRRVVDHLQRLVQRNRVVAGVVGQPQQRREGLVLRPNEVLSPDFDRVDPGLPGDQVHDAFDQVGRLRPAGPAIGVGRRGVCEDANRPAVERLHLVGALRDQHAQHLEGAELTAVAAEVEPLGRPDAEDRAIFLCGDLDVPDLVPTVVCCLDVFVAIFDPFDRPAQPP